MLVRAPAPVKPIRESKPKVDSLRALGRVESFHSVPALRRAPALKISARANAIEPPPTRRAGRALPGGLRAAARLVDAIAKGAHMRIVKPNRGGVAHSLGPASQRPLDL